ncbi:MAG: DUF1232 domain-containing protein [Anaerolineae bacterium]|nr:DUF1232 domain-containing protein [Anaerolineae bacterium]
MFEELKAWAKQLKRSVIVLFLAYRDPRTPWYARGLALLILGYALSPLDLIPDFVPVLGYLDDLILLPLGIALALRLIPQEVLAEARANAEQASVPAWMGSAGCVIVLWLLAGILILWRIFS